jgi:UDP-N-acetylmuramoyl-L-alanyl-D-glutamate--2,6-diaminopimelate ligase
VTVHRRRLSTCIGRPCVPNPWITDVALDSRAVTHGSLFVACRGETRDGHDFVDAAIAAGATAVVVDRDVGAKPVPVVRVDDTRREVSAIAARYFGRPSRRLGCIGVTGTNGKTSVAFYTADLLTRAGHPAGYGGTLGWGFGSRRRRTSLTTEDAVTLQRRLAELVDDGARFVALEVSSHALDQHRTDGVDFDVAVFTNLTRDHLDYHGTMERYGAAKARLFEGSTLRHAVVNVDDAFGRGIAARLPARVKCIRYGSGTDADVRYHDVVFGDAGMEGTLTTPWGRARIDVPLIGDFAFGNVAAATAAACAAGASFARVADAAHALTAPPGRMQLVRRAGAPSVIVDYAHTPDALAKALAAVRHHTRGRVLCVFGCGGDRDRGKRPLMAAAVEAGADAAIVTSDNPRSEDPAAIAADVERGFAHRIPVTTVLDRERAIAHAIADARPGDVVLVAGKGHEDYQEVAGVRRPFSDIGTVERLLEASA